MESFFAGKGWGPERNEGIRGEAASFSNQK